MVRFGSVGSVLLIMLIEPVRLVLIRKWSNRFLMRYPLRANQEASERVVVAYLAAEVSVIVSSFKQP